MAHRGLHKCSCSQRTTHVNHCDVYFSNYSWLRGASSGLEVGFLWMNQSAALKGKSVYQLLVGGNLIYLDFILVSDYKNVMAHPCSKFNIHQNFENNL